MLFSVIAGILLDLTRMTYKCLHLSVEKTSLLKFSILQLNWKKVLWFKEWKN